jgi:sugar O-acyltransferase (sialic acid O-acetyltransferase NeuD family)
MKDDLIIIGAGNVGGFLAYNLEEVGSYSILGFLDDDPNKQGKSYYGFAVLGVIIGIANPRIKRNIAEKFSDLPLRYPNVVFKNVWLSKNVRLGKGVILYPGVSINFETVIEDFVIVNMNCAIGHNCHVSKFSTLAPSVSLAGFSRIENCVDMGINSATLQNVNIGESAIVGGMAMVIDDLPPDCTAVGVPAKVIK